MEKADTKTDTKRVTAGNFKLLQTLVISDFMPVVAGILWAGN